MLRNSLLVLALTATTAAADPADKVEVHATASGELTFGDATSAAGFRGQFLLGKTIGRPLWKRDDVWSGKLSAIRPALALGPTIGAGAILADVPGAMSDRAWGNYRSIGVVAQVGLRFVDGGRIDDRIYASFSVLRTTLDHPTIQNQSETGVGLRASLGFNIGDAAVQASKDEDNWMIVLPHAWELVVQQDAGSTRFGFTVGYGL